MKTESLKWHQRLTLARQHKGLRKTAFADQVGVSPATVTDWENGKIKMLDADKMLRICDVLGVSGNWLIYGEDDHGAYALVQAFQELPREQREMVWRLISSYGVATPALPDPESDHSAALPAVTPAKPWLQALPENKPIPLGQKKQKPRA
jgi:transcriptional regulator with XRE-family HTH domain